MNIEGTEDRYITQVVCRKTREQYASVSYFNIVRNNTKQKREQTGSYGNMAAKYT